MSKNNDVRPEFDSHSRTHRVHHDAESSFEISTTIVFALSSQTGADPTQMRPLNGAVNPSVLEQHVQTRDRGAYLSFDFHGHHVTVRDDGQIEFTPLDEREE